MPMRELNQMLSRTKDAKSRSLEALGRPPARNPGACRLSEPLPWKRLTETMENNANSCEDPNATLPAVCQPCFASVGVLTARRAAASLSESVIQSINHETEGSIITNG